MPSENLTMSPLTPIAQKVCEKRYFQRDKNGNIIETWEQLVNRVVQNICKNEDDDFKNQMYELIYSTKFLPNSPCLVNAGNFVSGCLACHVSPDVEDSWVGMAYNIELFGHVARRGGGNGVCFSKIRPSGDPVFGSTHAKACGPVQHMIVVSEAMHSITQAGFRAMANMGTLHVNHPDIFEFIHCKQRDKALKHFLREDIFNHYDNLHDNVDNQLRIILDKHISNFNISIVVTDAFMKAVETDGDFNLEFDGKIYQTIKARELFNTIAENAWKNGDPGLLFDDAVNNGPYKYSQQKITATNPCGEQPLPPFGSCNLGSIDVSKFYDPKQNDLNWKVFAKTISYCIRFLDNVIDANKFPTKDFTKWAQENRPVGLGIMGLADLFLKMKIAYGSSKAIELSETIAEFLETEAQKESVKLAKERGTPKACDYQAINYRRNVTLTSIAPTGSISLLAGCSSSIEPVFSPSTFRYDNTGQYEIQHPDADQKYFRSAINSNQEKCVTFEEHIKMQAAFQKFGSSGISKTINLPNDATLEDVKNAYMMAWKLGCKGITVYRDGCKTTQVLNTSKKDMVGGNHALPRPREVDVDIFKTRADGFDWHVIVGKVNGTPYEVFAVNGKQDLPPTGKVVKRKKKHYSLLDDADNIIIENIGEEEDEIHPKIGLETRRFSLELRHNIDPKFIVEQIDKSSDVVTSFSKAVGRIMKTKYISADSVSEVTVPCTDCAKKGNEVQMIPEAGCWKCPICFSSKCG